MDRSTSHEADSLSVRCFLNSQDPSNKTDYIDLIAHSPEGPNSLQLLRRYLDDVQRSLAQYLPESEAVICIALDGTAIDVPLVCLCRGEKIRQSGSRSFLQLRAVAAPANELRRVNGDPLALYFSDAWVQMERGCSPSLRIQCRRHERLSSFPERVLQQFEGALQGSQVQIALAKSVSVREVLNGVRTALRRLDPKTRCGVSFAVGLPEDCKLPFHLNLVIPERELSPKPPAPPGSSSREIQSPLNGAKRSPLHPLEQLASQLEDNTRLPSLWQQRLWNRCQDLITLCEHPLAQQRAFSRAERQRFEVARRQLASELRRSGLAGEWAPQLENWAESLHRVFEPVPELSERIGSASWQGRLLYVVALLAAMILVGFLGLKAAQYFASNAEPIAGAAGQAGPSMEVRHQQNGLGGAEPLRSRQRTSHHNPESPSSAGVPGSHHPAKHGNRSRKPKRRQAVGERPAEPTPGT